MMFVRTSPSSSGISKFLHRVLPSFHSTGCSFTKKKVGLGTFQHSGQYCADATLRRTCLSKYICRLFPKKRDFRLVLPDIS
ncbi:hypothetical protein VTP01DRAFT_3944 [Rhizomucor pusillus]|uniref:uncharacterized protein n=1 Tax=Rhizomucor pusillus TaxID=4840 RepID=UPI0037449A96